MRIAYVCPGYPPAVGGVERHVSSLASRMARRGHEVEVLCQRGSGRHVEEVIDGVRVHRFPVRWANPRYGLSPALWRRLAANRDRWSIVHAQDYHAMPALGAAMARAPRLVFTPHYHGRGSSTASRLRNVLYRPAGALPFRRAASVICVSEAEAALVRSHHPAVALRLAVIPNGVSRMSKPRSDRQPEPIIICVGRLERYKNVAAVIRALVGLPEFSLRIVGEGSAAAELQEAASRANVARRVDFLGRLDDNALEAIVRGSRVLVTMSRGEAFGLTPLEALAAGTPVVASDIPAHRELGDKYGSERIRLVDADADPQSLAAAIRRAAELPAAVPPGLPTWDEVAQRTERLYLALVRGGPPPGGAPATLARPRR